MKRTPIAALVVLSLPLLACATSTETGSERVLVNSQPIQGGQIDSEHKNVVGLFMMSGGMCSGTLIAPNLVLTAQHCIAKLTPDLDGAVQCGVSKFLSPYSGKSVYVSTDTQLSQQGDFVQGAEVRVPSEGNDGCGFDVALIILSENLAVEPRTPRIDVEPQAGEPYTAVGYGVQNDYGAGGGTRMMLQGLSVQCSASECPSYYGVQSTEFMGETGICSGDSGGPAIDANGKVIGVVSRGLQGCESPTYGSVSAWRDWIMSVAVEAAEKGGYPAPFWALSGKSDPEPDPVGAGGQSGSGDPQGQVCNASSSCPAGYGCLVDTGSDGTCAAFCNESNPCGAGLECSATLKVCVSPASANPESGSSGGCSVGGGSDRGPVKPVPWIVGLGLAFLARRARRRG